LYDTTVHKFSKNLGAT